MLYKIHTPKSPLKRGFKTSFLRSKKSNYRVPLLGRGQGWVIQNYITI